MPVPKIIQRKSKRKDGTYPLYLQVYIDRKKAFIHLEQFVRAEQFNSERGVVRSHPNAKDINLLLQQALARANEILIRFRLSGERMTVTKFVKAYQNPLGMEDFLEFYEVEMHLQYQLGNIKEKTFIHHKRHLVRLRAWRKSLGEKTFLFYEINPQSLTEFDLYLVQQMKKAGHDGRGERYNCQKAIKKYLNIARGPMHKKIFEWPFPKGSKIHARNSRKTYLNETEVRALFRLLESDNELLTFSRRIVLRYFLCQAPPL